MLALAVASSLLLALTFQSPVVEKLNGPLVGDVSRFEWTADGQYVLYGAERDDPDVDVFTSLRLADGSEATFQPYVPMFGSAHVNEFASLPDRGLVGVRYFVFDGTIFPPVTSQIMHILERESAIEVTTTGDDPRFFADGRMLYRTFTHTFRGPTYVRGWSGRWNVPGPSIEISPPAQPDNHVSLILPAPQAGVALFGWRDSIYTSNHAELLAVPLDAGAPVALTPPPASGQRTWIDVVHVRASDELVLYQADEVPPILELWAVPVDGSLAPRRLNPPVAPGTEFYRCTVTPDETRIVYVADVEVADTYELWSTEIDSGASVRLSGPQVAGGDVRYDGFWITPDGARVVYLADQRVDGVMELYTAPIDGHAPATLLHPPLQPSSVALNGIHVTPDARLMVFAVRMPRGVVLMSARTDGNGLARPLNWPFPQGGGVFADANGIQTTVALTRNGRYAFFLGEQDTDGVVELYSVPIDGSAPPRKWNAPLVAGGNVTGLALGPRSDAVLYRADQDVNDHFELYKSALPDAPPPNASAGAPTGFVTVSAPDY